MKINKVWFAKLFPPPSTSAWIRPELIYIRTRWLYGMHERYIKRSDIEEVEVIQAGFWKSIFNYGDLIIKAKGDVVEKITHVSNPRFYEYNLTNPAPISNL